VAIHSQKRLLRWMREAAGTTISEEAMVQRNAIAESQRKILLRKLPGIDEAGDAGGDDILHDM
jgi:hypothetical protein